MNVLLLGGGGREHALAHAIAASPRLHNFWAAPGSGAIAALAHCVPLDPCDPAAVALFARDRAIDLVVIGPEAPLEAGVADALDAAGIAVFGPTAAAAQLETSKTFTKRIADAVGAPTAPWVLLDSIDDVRRHIAEAGAPIVVKADGLAAGKGVTVAATEAEAVRAAESILMDPGAQVLIERVLRGEEASLFVLCDGTRAISLGGAQDHKRAYDDDTGPNTGGMGAYTPAPVLTASVEERAMARIVRPVLAEMAARGTPYHGILYAGLMIDEGEPSLVEFNARFGDPEAQVLLPLLDEDLLALMNDAALGLLEDRAPRWRSEAALCVVMAARGYPGHYERGSEIVGIDAAAGLPGVQVLHAGTRRDGDTWRANGGRVLNIVATAPTLAEARDRAYAAVDCIDWPGGFCRRDIGWRAL